MISSITIKGFGGAYIHKNSQKRIIGTSRVNPLMAKEVFHYDVENKICGRSAPSFGGGYVHYDADGCYIGKSAKNPFGGYIHYDCNGFIAGKSEVALDGGYINHDIKILIFSEI